jgi:uncharacterized membrane protein YphA (DoxX/SURF4 family)
MLNVFPDLITYSFFAPTILRILVGLSFLYIAYTQFARRKEIAETGFPFVGKPNVALVYVSSIVIALVGAALCLGYATQIAALAGIVVSLKHAIFAKKYPRLIPLCRLEYVYILVICFTLLLTGAGLLAVDTPRL